MGRSDIRKKYNKNQNKKNRNQKKRE